MTGTHIVSERERIQTLAEEYRSKGYKVAIEPDSSYLPAFLSGYRPDLVVTRGDERTVIEVKSRQSLSAMEAQSQKGIAYSKGNPAGSLS